MTDLLILHNTFGRETDPLYQSRAGVMDQVHAVEHACGRLGLNHKTIAVGNLRDLAGILAGTDEKLVFNLIEEFVTAPADACVTPALCSAFGKKYTGNPTLTLLLARDKIQSKTLLGGAGLPCPDGTTFHNGNTIEKNLKPGKYILKPALCDASEGISAASVVTLPEENGRAAKLAKQLAQKHESPVIIEQFIGEREINVSVIEREGRAEVLPLAEIDFSAFGENTHKIVDYDAKWNPESFAFNNTPRKIPAELPEKTTRKISMLATAAWQAVGCRSYARVDFRLDAALNPYILEINPNPDISPDAGFSAALEAAGIEFEQFTKIVIENVMKNAID